MPELPEVETIKKELEKAVLNKRIIGVIVHNPKVIKQPNQEDFVRNLENTVIKNILRKGKLLIIELSPGKSLAIHLKMTGQLVYPGDAKNSRVSFKLSNGKYLDFNDRRLLGELRLLDDWKELKFIKELGPEPFDIDQEQFKKMLSGKKTKIKPLIMDQSFISGVGNLYAAEALFRAKINPFSPAISLSEKEIKDLFNAIVYILKEAIKHQGSSIDQYVRLNGRSGGYVKFHKVYGRQGKPCLICKTLIKRITLSGRGTYFCPKCQK